MAGIPYDLLFGMQAPTAPEAAWKAERILTDLKLTQQLRKKLDAEKGIGVKAPAAEAAKPAPAEPAEPVEGASTDAHELLLSEQVDGSPGMIVHASCPSSL